MVGRAASIQIVAFAVILAGAAWQPVRAADTATQHASSGTSCARSTFRVLIDVGHTATSPGADSARGVPEYEFNLKLADVIAQSLHDLAVLLLLTSPPRTLSAVGGGSAAGPSHSRHLRHAREVVAIGGCSQVVDAAFYP